MTTPFTIMSTKYNIKPATAPITNWLKKNKNRRYVSRVIMKMSAVAQTWQLDTYTFPRAPSPLAAQASQQSRDI